MKNKNMVLGIILLLAGVVLGLIALELIPGVSFLFIISAGFILMYFLYEKRLGFIITGLMVFAVSLFSTLALILGELDGSYFLLMLGISFTTVFLIHTINLKTENWGEKYWPLFPGLSLFLIGFLTALSDSILLMDKKYTDLLIPIVVIIAGIILLIRSSSISKAKNNN